MKKTQVPSNTLFSTFYEIAHEKAAQRVDELETQDDYYPQSFVDETEVLEEAVKKLGIRRAGIDFDLLHMAVETAVEEEMDAYEFAMQCGAERGMYN